MITAMQSFFAMAAVIISNQDATNLKSVADRLHSSVIEVKSSTKDEGPTWGTGVLLGDGLALTALHSVGVQGKDGHVSAMGDVVAIVYERGEVRAHVVAGAPELDLAILRLDSKDAPAPAPLAMVPPAVGERLVAMGASDEQIVAAGVTVSGESDDGSLLLISTRNIDSRFWGGPLFDGEGHLAAMTLSSMGQIKAMSISSLRSFIDQAAAAK
jgi:S1-C subfamily serine protease